MIFMQFLSSFLFNFSLLNWFCFFWLLLLWFGIFLLFLMALFLLLFNLFFLFVLLFITFSFLFFFFLLFFLVFFLHLLNELFCIWQEIGSDNCLKDCWHSNTFISLIVLQNAAQSSLGGAKSSIKHMDILLFLRLQ